MSGTWASSVYTVLNVVGGLLLLWGLFGDWVRQRFVHRRRCPKCWYDMSKTPGLQCSECGFVARREQKLFKGRTRRWMVIAALMLFFAAYGLDATPRVKQRGWLAAVPTTVLILFAPLGEDAFEQSSSDWREFKILARSTVR